MSPRRRPWLVWLNRAVTALALVGSCWTGLRQDEVECELAGAHLDDCCPGRPSMAEACSAEWINTCSGTDFLRLPLPIEASACIEGLSCAQLEALGICDDPFNCPERLRLRDCGDGSVQSGEDCDDQNDDDYDGCTSDCRAAPTCGDGQATFDEGCDDGNRDPGDGCADDCQLEPGFVCPAGGAPCSCLDSNWRSLDLSGCGAGASAGGVAAAGLAMALDDAALAVVWPLTAGGLRLRGWDFDAGAWNASPVALGGAEPALAALPSGGFAFAWSEGGDVHYAELDPDDWSLQGAAVVAPGAQPDLAVVDGFAGLTAPVVLLTLLAPNGDVAVWAHAAGAWSLVEADVTADADAVSGVRTAARRPRISGRADVAVAAWDALASAADPGAAPLYLRRSTGAAWTPYAAPPSDSDGGFTEGAAVLALAEASPVAGLAELYAAYSPDNSALYFGFHDGAAWDLIETLSLYGAPLLALTVLDGSAPRAAVGLSEYAFAPNEAISVRILAAGAATPLTLLPYVPTIGEPPTDLELAYGPEELCVAYIAGQVYVRCLRRGPSGLD